MFLYTACEQNERHPLHDDVLGSILREASYRLSSSITELLSSRYFATCNNVKTRKGRLFQITLPSGSTFRMKTYKYLNYTNMHRISHGSPGCSKKPKKFIFVTCSTSYNCGFVLKHVAYFNPHMVHPLSTLMRYVMCDYSRNK